MKRNRLSRKEPSPPRLSVSLQCQVSASFSLRFRFVAPIGCLDILLNSSGFFNEVENQQLPILFLGTRKILEKIPFYMNRVKSLKCGGKRNGKMMIAISNKFSPFLFIWFFFIFLNNVILKNILEQTKWCNSYM